VEAAIGTAEQVSEAARELAHLSPGKTGNLSARAPGEAAFWITPSGIPYAELSPERMVKLSLGGTQDRPEILSPSEDAPSSEWRFHRDLYRSRDDLGALVHTHSTAATALACTERGQRDGLPAVHYMLAIAGGALRCAPYATFGTQALSDHVCRAMDGRRACLMAPWMNWRHI